MKMDVGVAEVFFNSTIWLPVGSIAYVGRPGSRRRRQSTRKNSESVLLYPGDVVIKGRLFGYQVSEARRQSPVLREG